MSRLFLVFSACFVASLALEFKILHINDMHARVEGMKSTGGCVQAENDLFECDGGWARLLTAAKDFVQKTELPVIFIDNGDQFSGTPWSTFYRGEEALILKNKFCEEAGFLLCLTGLGNHEFDFGYTDLLHYVENSNHDVIVSNLVDQCSEQDSALGKALKRHITVEISGITIGFVGYVLSSTPASSSPPDCLIFEKEEVALEREIENLKARDIDVIIAIGHSGLEKELEISEIFKNDLDLIVGGHSHSFLWDENKQGPVPAQSDVFDDDGELDVQQDTPVDSYPAVADASTVPVVQAFFGSRYLGAVKVSFDVEGRLVTAEPETVILSDIGSKAPGNQGFAPDPSMLETVNELMQPLLEFINKPIGSIPRDLLDTVDEVRRIRQVEMPLGNFVCDAFMAASPENIQFCLMNGGGIRAPLLAGDVSFGEAITVFPFGNTLSFLNFTGARIHQALEFSVHKLPDENGGFLHFSKGFQVFFDPLLEPFNRVLNISLNGELIPNDESQVYQVVTNSFTAAGGDGFNEIMTGATVIDSNGEPMEDVLARYIENNPELCQTVDNRVVAVNNPVDEEGNEVDLLGLEFDDCLVRFSVLHINDMHARVQGMRGTGGCTTAQNLNAECDGGWGRVFSAGRRFVEETDNPVVFVDNGDEFSGTVWSTFYKGNETIAFLNHLCKPKSQGGVGFHTCLSGIGNHEFDFGYGPLLSFSRKLRHEIVTGNIQDSCKSNSQGIPHFEGELGGFFKESHIIEIQGKRVGFIGYTLKETAGLSSAPSCLTFEDEEAAVERGIAELKEKGVDLIIAIGHSGISKDLDIAAEFDDIDLIVGGHTHTFLWNENEQGPIPAQSRPVEEDGELIGLRKDELLTPLNVYPRFESGDDTPVLQAFFGSRYMGAIDLTFDFDGKLLAFERKTLILSNEDSAVAGATVFNETTNEANSDPSKAFSEDESMMALVNQLLAPLDAFANEPVGEAFIDFQTNYPKGVSIRNSETPLGNLLCDAMMDNFNSKDGLQVDICFQNGGGIRAPIPKGLVSFGGVIEVHPFGNVLTVLDFTGKRVHDAVEFGLGTVEGGFGAFLSVGAGMKIIYDPRRPVGSRVINITVNGELVEKDESKHYNVVTNNFVADGGDLFGEIFSDAPRLLETGEPQEDAVAEYLSKFCPSCVEVEGRIVPVVNPLSLDGEVIDILGTDFGSCRGVTEAVCQLDVQNEEDGSEIRVGLIAAVALVSVLAFGTLVVFVRKVYKDYNINVKILTKVSSAAELQKKTVAESLGHYTL